MLSISQCIFSARAMATRFQSVDIFIIILLMNKRVFFQGPYLKSNKCVKGYRFIIRKQFE